MDSSAYLVRHGWLGEGHALHPTGRGIKKPLLVSKKNNVLGLGKRNVDVHADQWWARAFDTGLRSLDVNSSGKSVEHNTCREKNLGSLDLARLSGGRWAGLYSSFVKGKGLEGTIDKSYDHRKAHVTASAEEGSLGTTLRCDVNTSSLDASRCRKNRLVPTQHMEHNISKGLSDITSNGSSCSSHSQSWNSKTSTRREASGKSKVSIGATAIVEKSRGKGITSKISARADRKRLRRQKQKNQRQSRICVAD